MSRLRGAFIGFGRAAEHGHWPAYAAHPACEIVAAADPAAPRLEAARQLQPALRLYRSASELLAVERPEFVDICTPPAAHAELALQALRAGCHVLCEKPLALKPSELAELSAEASRRQRVLFTVHNWKYAPSIRRALDLVREGRIGAVWHVELFTLRPGPCPGSAEAWRADPALAGGGILVDHGWHAFYLLMNLAGQTPQRVLSKMRLASEHPEALEEAVETLVQFPAAHGYIHLTWRSAVRRNAIVIQGESGTLLLDDDRLLATWRGGGREEVVFERALSADSHHSDWFRDLLPDFLGEIADPARRGANLREAAWCLELTRAAYESNLHGFKDIPVAEPRLAEASPALA